MIFSKSILRHKCLAAEGALISDAGKLTTTYSSCILFFLHRPWKPDKYSNCCEIESGHLHDDDLCF